MRTFIFVLFVIAITSFAAVVLADDPVIKKDFQPATILLNCGTLKGMGNLVVIENNQTEIIPISCGTNI